MLLHTSAAHRKAVVMDLYQPNNAHQGLTSLPSAFYATVAT